MTHPSRNSFSAIPPLRVRVFLPEYRTAQPETLDARVARGGVQSGVDVTFGKQIVRTKENRLSMVMAGAVRSVDTRRKPASRRAFGVPVRGALFAASARQPTPPPPLGPSREGPPIGPRHDIKAWG